MIIILGIYLWGRPTRRHYLNPKIMDLLLNKHIGTKKKLFALPSSYKMKLTAKPNPVKLTGNSL